MVIQSTGGLVEWTKIPNFGNMLTKIKNVLNLQNCFVM